MNIEVKELTESEIPHIVSYWNNCSMTELHRMGADPKKLPDRDDLKNMLIASLTQALDKRNSYCLIWHLDGEAIGHCNTNPTRFGHEAYMHLHLWRPDLRGKGIGIEAVRSCAPLIKERLQLQHLYSRPKSDNKAAHAVLSNCGFKSLGTMTCTPGSINYEQEVELWEYTHQ